MKTIIYELLGMIKDGKAPKKIKYENFYCYYDEEKNEYVDYTGVPFFEWDYVVMNGLNNTVEILEEEKELHANDIEFNISVDKRDCVITLDENDFGIDKLHLDNCYFFKENDKWYVKKYNFKTIKLEEEKEIPKKLPIGLKQTKDGIFNTIVKDDNRYELNEKEEIICKKIHEIIDYLDYLKSKGE